MEASKKAIYFKKVQEEPLARLLNIRLKDVDDGYALCEMEFIDTMENIYGSAHGGAIFSLIDEAFEVASNSHGVMAVALNVNIQYIRPALAGDMLTAEAKELSRSKKISTYDIDVHNANAQKIASARCMAFIKGDKLPFLE